LYVATIATALWWLRAQLGWTYDTRFALALFGMNMALIVPLVWGLDRGRVIRGTVAPRAGNVPRVTGNVQRVTGNVQRGVGGGVV
jgi:hypothetical protein